MDNTVKFTGKADRYRKYRPSYPQALIDYLFNECSITEKSIVADVGAGTGIFSKCLLDSGCSVIAVEPNADMRNAAQSFLQGYEKLTLVNGTDEATSVSAHSVDLITVAQAFHWFDGEKFKLECRRILKPGAKVALVWNSRDFKSEFVIQHAEICCKFCPDFHGFSGGVSQNSANISTQFFGHCEHLLFPNDLEYDMDGFIGHSLSASYAPNENEQTFDAFIFELKQLFEKYSNHGKVIVPNITASYLGKV